MWNPWKSSNQTLHIAECCVQLMIANKLWLSTLTLWGFGSRVLHFSTVRVQALVAAPHQAKVGTKQVSWSSLAYHKQCQSMNTV